MWWRRKKVFKNHCYFSVSFNRLWLWTACSNSYADSRSYIQHLTQNLPCNRGLINIYYITLVWIKKGRESSIVIKRERVSMGARKCHGFSLLYGEKQSHVLKAKFYGFLRLSTVKLYYCETGIRTSQSKM